MAGKKQGAQVTGKARKARTDEEKAELDEQYEPMVDANDEDQILLTASVGMFQAQPPRMDFVGPNRSIPVETQGIEWDFGTRFARPVSQEEADIAEQILDGKYENGSVSAKVLQRLALESHLRLIQPGLVGPPALRTWHTLSPDQVVPVAVAAGALATEADVLHAIKYEQQASKRVLYKNERGKKVYDEPREKVLSDLVTLLEEKRGVLRTVDSEHVDV